MKRLLLIIIIMITTAGSAYSQEGDGKSRSVGFSLGCFTPEDKDYDEIYGDKREPTFSIFYDRSLSERLSWGGTIMYYEDEGIAVSPALIASDKKTELAIVKAELSLIYRMTDSDDRVVIPQIKAGLSETYFSEKGEDQKTIENAYLGYHAGFALLFLIDGLDPDYARNLKMDYGIANTYLTISADYTNTDDINDNALDLGGMEYSIGLTFRY